MGLFVVLKFCSLFLMSRWLTVQGDVIGKNEGRQILDIMAKKGADFFPALVSIL